MANFSRFEALPTEILTMIWRYVLADAHLYMREGRITRHRSTTFRPSWILSLLQLSKTLQPDLLPLILTETTLFATDMGSVAVFSPFARDLIRNLDFPLTVGGSHIPSGAPGLKDVLGMGRLPNLRNITLRLPGWAYVPGRIEQFTGQMPHHHIARPSEALIVLLKRYYFRWEASKRLLRKLVHNSAAEIVICGWLGFRVDGDFRSSARTFYEVTISMSDWVLHVLDAQGVMIASIPQNKPPWLL